MPAAYGRSSVLRVDPAINHEIDKLYQMIQGQIGPENLNMENVRREICKQVTDSECRIVNDLSEGDIGFTGISIGDPRFEPANTLKTVYGVRQATVSMPLSSLAAGAQTTITTADLTNFVNSPAEDLVFVSAAPTATVTNEEYISFRPHVDKAGTVSVVATNKHGSVAYSGTFNVVVMGAIFNNRKEVVVANTAGVTATAINPSAS